MQQDSSDGQLSRTGRGALHPGAMDLEQLPSLLVQSRTQDCGVRRRSIQTQGMIVEDGRGTVEIYEAERRGGSLRWTIK